MVCIQCGHLSTVTDPCECVTKFEEAQTNSIAMDTITPDLLTKQFKKPSALSSQVGGGHYKKQKIQPWEYISANNLGFFEGNVVKYITRHKDKNGVEDLKKARHYLDYLIELAEKDTDA